MRRKTLPCTEKEEEEVSVTVTVYRYVIVSCDTDSVTVSVCVVSLLSVSVTVSHAGHNQHWYYQLSFSLYLLRFTLLRILHDRRRWPQWSDQRVRIASNLFLNVFTFGAFTTESGNSFHTLVIYNFNYTPTPTHQQQLLFLPNKSTATCQCQADGKRRSCVTTFATGSRKRQANQTVRYKSRERSARQRYSRVRLSK